MGVRELGEVINNKPGKRGLRQGQDKMTLSVSVLKTTSLSGPLSLPLSLSLPPLSLSLPPSLSLSVSPPCSALLSAVERWHLNRDDGEGGRYPGHLEKVCVCLSVSVSVCECVSV